jgi:serine/threonine-protein kinase PknG
MSVPSPTGAPGDVACAQPGCDGVIEDGFCGECGLAPRTVEAPPTPPTSGTVAASAALSTSGATVGRSGSIGSRGARSTRRTGSTRTGSGRSRGQLGGGLVDVPPVPVLDPSTVLLSDPEVPEHSRFCGACGGPVGRGRDGRPGRATGFCPKDGTPFSFVPTLKPDELVAGQYEVRGCLAHGGMGWIYLAVDRNVSDRWVVLKGLLNAGDAEAMAAAVAERRFLAEVNHPNIVKIYNFVQHPGADGTPVGYIVMEYVGGSSLKQLLSDRRRPDGSFDPMPVPHAIAYAMEVLAALGYLHARGLAYCDFKPENAIQYERQLKLIDLGAVLRLDDEHSPVFGTVGYQAPEVAKQGPSPGSDVHTVGRSLAVLALGMPPQRRGAPNPLPDTHPVLAAHPSFHQLLLRATDDDAARRFETCEEMADQLEAVLREVLSAADGRPRPAPSTRFGLVRGDFAQGLLIDEPGDGPPDGTPDGPPDRTDGTPGPATPPGRPDLRRLAAALPVPLVDPTDPTAALLATVGDDRDAVTKVVTSTTEPTPELRLRLVRAHLAADDPSAADAELRTLEAELAGDWRLNWYRALAALLADQPDRAADEFGVVYATLPGEAAPKLALAATAEATGDDADAEPLYTLIARVDPGLTDAAFGRARIALRADDRDTALTALDAVPTTSNLHVAAQLAAVTAQLRERSRAPGTRLTPSELTDAAHRVERLNLDPATQHRVRATVLTAALELGEQRNTTILGLPWGDRELRQELERCLRGSARLALVPAERVALVDRANSVRPRTWT